MVIKREIAYGIVQGLSDFWNCEQLQDFTVTVGKTNFGCHKLLLAACSGFFRALFRSGMKESKENCVTLEEISSETFHFILEAIYTGRGILTDDNLIDIWRATDQLQMTFMVTECEMFVIKSLSLKNCFEYLHYGKMFSSEIVTGAVWNFFLQNFNSFCKTGYFLELHFNDILSLIKSQDLSTSTEDDVLQAIVEWIEYTPEKKLRGNTNFIQDININTYTIRPNVKRSKGSGANSDDFSDGNSTAMCPKYNTTFNNNLMSCYNSVLCEERVSGNKTELCDGTLTDSDNRNQYLFELVSNTRTCLASHGCLEMLLSHPLVSETEQVQNVIARAILYQFQTGERNGQWPTAATHRNNNEYENVAITFTSDSKVMMYSFSQNNWNEYKSTAPFDNKMIIQMVTIGNSLYILCVENGKNDYSEYYHCRPCLVYLLSDSKEWSPINVSLKIFNTEFSLVAVDGCIYIVQMEQIWKLNPLLPSLVSLCDLPVEESEYICHLTYYDKTIIAFYNDYTTCLGDTDILSFDIANNNWTRLKHLEGSAHGLVSFKDDHSFYFLQPTGDLWKLVKPQSGVVDFELVAKLWGSFWQLHGAVIFLDELYLYGNIHGRFADDSLRLKCFSGLFKKINYMYSPEFWYMKEMFVPFIVDKKLIVSI